MLYSDYAGLSRREENHERIKELCRQNPRKGDRETSQPSGNRTTFEEGCERGQYIIRIQHEELLIQGERVFIVLKTFYQTFQIFQQCQTKICRNSQWQ